MTFHLAGRTVQDVDATAVCLPSRHCGGETVIGISDPPVMLLFELVLDGSGGRVAADPELLDEGFALRVALQTVEGRPLFVRDDVNHILGAISATASPAPAPDPAPDGPA